MIKLYHNSFSYLILIFFSLYSYDLFCQNEDNNWLMGYSKSIGNAGNSIWNFSNDSLKVENQDWSLYAIRTVCMMSDTIGNPLFASNGLWIANALKDTMKNGKGLNPGYWAKQWDYEGYHITDGILVLKNIDKPSIYHMYHQCRSEDSTISRINRILRTTIDMELDDGLGGVIEKNYELWRNDTSFIGTGSMNAVRHANGEDWWIVTCDGTTGGIRSILLTSDSTYIFPPQYFGHNLDSGVSQCEFSPDGLYYACGRIELIDKKSLSLYHFDRCSGRFDEIFYDQRGAANYFGTGISFSPSGRYLYEFPTWFAIRYDMEAPNVLQSRDTIAEWNGVLYTWPGGIQVKPRFFLSQLAPDGNIYILPEAATPLVHKLIHPDNPDSTKLIQSIELPKIVSSSIPNYPNYRLGALTGSPCAFMFGAPSASFSCTGVENEFQFVDLSMGVPLQWKWYFGDGDSTELQQPEHIYQKPGTYVVCLKVTNIYGSDTFCKPVTVTTSSINISEIESITLEPNPAKDFIRVKLNASNENKFHFFIKDILGKEWMHWDRYGMEELEQDISGLTGGVYFLEVIDKDLLFTLMWVKE